MIGAQLRGVKDEIAHWRAIGQRPALWIRDDDAQAVWPISSGSQPCAIT